MIGVDPGLARTGIGVILSGAGGWRHVHHEVVRTDPRAGLSDRLAQISERVTEACGRHRPGTAVIERTFISENFASSHALGQARGAALAALGMAGIKVLEVAPNTVKRRVTGNALAGKPEVSRMVRGILSLPSSTKLPADAADALAIALSHTETGRSWSRLRRGRRRRGR